MLVPVPQVVVQAVKIVDVVVAR